MMYRTTGLFIFLLGIKRLIVKKGCLKLKIIQYP